MKVVILAGGYGTRISEYTELIPKPMVQIGKQPILIHIMNIYSFYGYKEFIIALGYKSEIIQNYFNTIKSENNNKIQLLTQDSKVDVNENVNWRVRLVDTGLKTMTGGRIKRMKDYIGNETFLLTYGDGVADINLDNLYKFHKDHGKMVTVTAVHPTARFGEILIKDNKVVSFKEKPQTTRDWINGGYFVVEPDFFDLIDDDSTVLEEDPLERVAQMGELMAYKHEGFWQCMDTKRDRDLLDELCQKGKAPWQN